MVKALLLEQADDGSVEASIQEVADEALPEGDVELSVLYSSLNYKDGLAVTGEGKIVRAGYPFVPGIDMVGRVEASRSERFAPGDMVLQTGYGLGETRWGGYATRQRAHADELVALPVGISQKEAMVIGTAGFTAMLSVIALERYGVEPGDGEVVVTGASGGVGSFAVALLAHLGYEVVASTGKTRAHDYLEALGARRFIPREDLGSGPRRPMDSARWAGAVDTVGGETLAALISQIGRHGAVSSCGLAGGYELHTTVYPFILRGVSLIGIDSNTSPRQEREAAWRRLARDLSGEVLEQILEEVIPLDTVPQRSQKILRGEVQGRIVVDVQAGGQ